VSLRLTLTLTLCRHCVSLKFGMWGDLGWHANHICCRYNCVREVTGMDTDPAGRIHRPYYTFGIYLDNWASGYEKTHAFSIALTYQHAFNMTQLAARPSLR
jgi:hypothetical protein